MKSLILKSVRAGLAMIALGATLPMPGCTSEERQFGAEGDIPGVGGTGNLTGGASGNSGGSLAAGGTGMMGSGGVPSSGGVIAVAGAAGMATIECSTDASCGTAKPHCNSAGACVECTLGSQCTSGACNTDGTCNSCAGDSDCTDPNKTRCDLNTRECQACLPTNDNCAQGKKCVLVNSAYECADGCQNTAACVALNGANSICCGDVCVDRGTDSANCGACATSCNGTACCNAACINYDTDPNNCGGCGRVCSGTNIASPMCSGGQCVGACNAGSADCDTDKRTNGCEVNTLTDASNCGACGSTCSTAGVTAATCGAGVCNGACASGRADCDGNKLTNGCEVDVTSSADNCGACGTVCSNTGMSTRTCAAGSCNGTCAPGRGDCNNNKKSDGCELATIADPNNCGGCGVVCSNSGMQTRTCGAGVCNGTCTPGMGDCNNNKHRDGCEITTTTNPDNCGTCGTVCSNMGMAARTCGGGNCNGTCASGFADCNNNKYPDGCEVNTTTDASNCGACGQKCNLTCTTSQCTWDTGTQHGFAGLSSTHYITQSGCGLGSDAADAAYFCTRFYGNACTAQTYTPGPSSSATAPKMHKNEGCTSQGNDIPGRTCQGACKIGDWNEPVNGLNNLTCRCPSNLPFAQFGGREWYKVQVFGAMSSANVKAACLRQGLKVPCTGDGTCTYNDAGCSPTAELGCGNPMENLSTFLCGAIPSTCPPLYGVYQHMGGAWSDGSACGADMGVWCSPPGNSVNNKYALCVN